MKFLNFSLIFGRAKKNFSSNRLLFGIFCALFLSSCSNNSVLNISDDLLIPPHFKEMPPKDSKKSDVQKVESQKK